MRENACAFITEGISSFALELTMDRGYERTESMSVRDLSKSIYWTIWTWIALSCMERSRTIGSWELHESVSDAFEMVGLKYIVPDMCISWLVQRFYVHVLIGLRDVHHMLNAQTRVNKYQFLLFACRQLACPSWWYELGSTQAFYCKNYIQNLKFMALRKLCMCSVIQLQSGVLVRRAFETLIRVL